MSTDGVRAEEVPLSDLVRAAGLIALTVAGVVIFVPAFILLLARGNSSFSDWLAWLIPVGIWSLGFVPTARPSRAWIQSGAGVLFMLMAAVVPGDAWIPVSTIAFAVVVAAIFTLPWQAAGILIVITSALDVVLALVPSAAVTLYDAGPFPVATGALLQILAGGGLLIAWRSWVSTIESADIEHAEIREATEARERLRARSDSSAAVARRIHETILNTLTAISIGIPPDSETAARQACRHDLEQMELGLKLLPDSTIAEILQSATEVTTLRRVDVDLGGSTSAKIPAVIANPIRDAVAEALRNVERHSGENAALIRARVDDEVRIQISDRGVGMSEGALERFGLRNAIRTGVESVGGRVEVRAPTSGGTVVSLAAPASVPAPSESPRLPLLGALDSSPAARFGVLGTSAFMAIFAVPVAQAMTHTAVVLSGILLYIGILVAVAILWTSRLRIPLTVTAIAVLLATFTVVATSDLDCGSEWAVVILLTGMSGGATLLPLVSLRGWWVRISFLVAVGCASLAVPLSLPDTCRSLPLLTAFSTVAYVLAFTVGLTWADVVFEGRRQRAQEQWRALLRSETEVESRAAALSGWGEVGPGARDLLEGLADGSLRMTDPGVRARAAAEGAAIREALGFADAPGDAVSHLTRRLVRAAAHVSATVDVEILTPFTRADRYPDDVLVYLESLVRRTPEQNLAIRGFSDEGYEELVMIVPIEAIRDASTRFIQDCAVQVSLGSESAHVIVRRRETQA